jgi:hypothetical protein
MNNTNWCDYHKGWQTSVLVRIEQRQSGSTPGYYACAPCRTVRGLKPLVEVEDTAQAAK